MKGRIPLKNLWVLLQCAPLIGLSIYLGGFLAIWFIEPLSKLLFRLGVTNGYLSEVRSAASSTVTDVVTEFLAAICVGFILAFPVVLIGAVLQPPPHRVARSFARAPRSLLIGSPLLMLLNTLALCSTFVTRWTDGEWDFVWIAGAAVLPPVICIWAYAAQRRTRAWIKVRARRRRELCAVCSYDLRNLQSKRCPECGAQRTHTA